MTDTTEKVTLEWVAARYYDAHQRVLELNYERAALHDERARLDKMIDDATRERLKCKDDLVEFAGRKILT